VGTSAVVAGGRVLVVPPPPWRIAGAGHGPTRARSRAPLCVLPYKARAGVGSSQVPELSDAILKFQCPKNTLTIVYLAIDYIVDSAVFQDSFCMESTGMSMSDVSLEPVSAARKMLSCSAAAATSSSSAQLRKVRLA